MNFSKIIFTFLLVTGALVSSVAFLAPLPSSRGVSLPSSVKFGDSIKITPSQDAKKEDLQPRPKKDFLTEKGAPVTRGDFEQAMSALACDDFDQPFLNTVSADTPLKKSVVVQEIAAVVEARLPKGFALPADFATIRFGDVPKESTHEYGARMLQSLGILEVKNGLFGQKGDPDPVLTQAELRGLLHRSFDFEQCGQELQNDRDSDGIVNEKDRCPDIPGVGDGCPKITLFPFSRGANRPSVRLVIAKNQLELTFVEQAEIQLGDEFTAVVWDKRTEEIFSKSDPVLVSR